VFIPLHRTAQQCRYCPGAKAIWKCWRGVCLSHGRAISSCSRTTASSITVIFPPACTSMSYEFYTFVYLFRNVYLSRIYSSKHLCARTHTHTCTHTHTNTHTYTSLSSHRSARVLCPIEAYILFKRAPYSIQKSPTPHPKEPHTPSTEPHTPSTEPHTPSTEPHTPSEEPCIQSK